MRISALLASTGLASALSSGAYAAALTDQPLVDAEWLQSQLGNQSLVVLDIRDLAEDKDLYALGHIPGAVNAPYSTAGWRTEVNGVPGELPPVPEIEALIERSGVSSDDHVVIVAQGTDSSEFGAATRVYWTFKVLGHDAVSILDGGYRAWEAAGGEADTAAVAPQPGQFDVNYRAEMVATTADVEAAIQSGTTLVDGRPAEQFRGEVKPPVARVPGTIPGAVNLAHSNFYDADAADFADREQVASLAQSIGLDESEANITFCNTGHWASIPWFAMSEVLGNKNTKMYDGSMAEWTADPARPVQ